MDATDDIWRHISAAVTKNAEQDARLDAQDGRLDGFDAMGRLLGEKIDGLGARLFNAAVAICVAVIGAAAALIAAH